MSVPSLEAGRETFSVRLPRNQPFAKESIFAGISGRSKELQQENTGLRKHASIEETAWCIKPRPFNVTSSVTRSRFTDCVRRNTEPPLAQLLLSVSCCSVFQFSRFPTTSARFESRPNYPFE